MAADGGLGERAIGMDAVVPEGGLRGWPWRNVVEATEGHEVPNSSQPGMCDVWTGRCTTAEGWQAAPSERCRYSRGGGGVCVGPWCEAPEPAELGAGQCIRDAVVCALYVL